MTSAVDLARRPAFRLGGTLIAPASRELSGPGGAATIEPRVMQVLVVLAEARGAVVTREDLIRLCWNTPFVGDDAVNRAVGEVRRVARTVAAGGFAIETIPRTGYRLTGAAPEPETPQATTDSERRSVVRPSRRVAIGLGAGALAAAGAAAWLMWPDDTARRAADLAAQAQVATRDELPEGYGRAVALLRQAVALRPKDAGLWGRLALAWRGRTDALPSAEIAGAVQACEQAAGRALALDPGQAEAQVALILLRSSYGDWLTYERQLGAVLARRPGLDEAAAPLAMMLQAVGRTRESAELNGATAARNPLSPVYQYRHTYGLWDLGRLGDADRNADRDFELWPRHPGVWFARLWLMGFTGRAALALAQIDDAESRPASMSDAGAQLLRLSMQAIQTRRSDLVRAATAANVAAAMTGPGGSVNAIMILTALGCLDEAFTVADGYLLRRGPSLTPLGYTRAQTWVNDQRHRKTMMLFVPVTAPLRADPRFDDLMRGAGLVDYWRASGHWPDYLGARRVG